MLAHDEKVKLGSIQLFHDRFLSLASSVEDLLSIVVAYNCVFCYLKTSRVQHVLAMLVGAFNPSLANDRTS
jgi:hypothetical protein